MLPRVDDRARDPARGSLLAVFVQNPRELGLAFAVDEIGRGERLLGVHPHVERTVEAKAETARWIVERQAAHSKICYNRIDAIVAGPIENRVDRSEVGMMQTNSRAEASQPLARDGKRRRVSIESDEARLGRVQQSLGMAAGSDRRIHDRARTPRHKQRADLGHHHRNVSPFGGRVAHVNFNRRVHRLQIQFLQEPRIANRHLDVGQMPIERPPIPELEVIDHRRESRVAFESGIFAKPGGYDDASRLVDLNFVGAADVKSLERANLRAEGLLLLEPAYQPLPFARRIELEASLLVEVAIRDVEQVVVVALQDFAEAHRDTHASFFIDGMVETPTETRYGTHGCPPNPL